MSLALSNNHSQNTIAFSNEELQQMSNAVAALSMDAVEQANSGHPGMPMGMKDVATVLFTKFLKFNPHDAKWFDRDRFILSAGHGSMLLYSLLYLSGYDDISIDDIKNFRQLHAKTCGHPEYGELAAIETTTGPLGQGIANAVGFALAEKKLANEFNSKNNHLIDHYTYVIAGDGCLMEGISQEAISLAGHLKLNKLIVLFDDNGISIDGPTSLTTSEDHLLRFKACGWNVDAIDGHNFSEIEQSIAKAKKSDKPTMIACRTTIGKGAPTKAGKSSSHGSPLGADELAQAKKNIGWSYEAFEIPDNILANWRKATQQNKAIYDEWQNKLNSLDKETQTEIKRRINGQAKPELANKFAELHKQISSNPEKLASRAASGKVLAEICDFIPELIGGSADLTGSNLTKNNLQPITPDDFSGRYIYYGIREHAMCAMMNGIILHGGLLAYGGTFFVFTDYCRPSIRLAALMRIPAIYVMTHDSIGLGEDGPTHQPVEHLASFRAMPNVNVLRPADYLETLEAWQIALEAKETPSILVLSRQGLTPLTRENGNDENLSKRGGYAVNNIKNPDAIIAATGSEVELAIKAEKELKSKGISTRVISIPSFELLDAQGDDYISELFSGFKKPIIAIEAAVQTGWEKYLYRSSKNAFIGMNSFGASAPADELYNYFGITVSNVVKSVEKLM